MQPTIGHYFDTSRPAILLAIFVFFATNALTPLLSSSGDNANYILLAKSLVEGHGYSNTFYPGEPAETQYPPLLPVLLVPILLTVGENYLIMKLIPLVFGTLGLAAMYRLLREIVDADTAWAAILLTASNANYICFGSSILTETIYVCLSAWALLFLHRIEQCKKDRLGLLLVAAVLIALSFYTRTIGATLAVSGCAYLFLRRRYKSAIILAACISCLLLPWALRSILLHNSYFGQLTVQSANEDTETLLFFSRIAHNLPRFAGKVMADLAGGPAISQLSPYQPVKVAGSIVLSGIFLFGYLHNLKTRLTIENTYLLVYLGILVLWPYHDSRFFLPILPLMLTYMLEGLRHLPTKKSQIQQRLFTGTTLVLLVLGLGTSLHHVYFNKTTYYTPEIANFREACLWIKTHTPKEALIISRKPRLAAIWAQRKSGWYKNPRVIPDRDDLGNPMQVTHVIVTEFPIAGINFGEGFQYLHAANPQRFHLLYRTPQPAVSVYAVQTP